MTRLSACTMRRAFSAFVERHKDDWLRELGNQLACYASTTEAVSSNDPAKFKTGSYKLLRGKMKVGRGGKLRSARWVFDKLRDIEPEMRGRRLSSLRTNDWVGVTKAVLSLRGVKGDDTKPSVTAISKFLHFYNPRLFVMCDRAEIRHFVFEHRWLRKQMESSTRLLAEAGVEITDSTDIWEYLQIMVLANRIMKLNRRHMLTEFARAVRRLPGGDSAPADIRQYEATAVEWLLIGLAEAPAMGGTTL